MTTKNFQQALNEEFSQQTYGENPVELYARGLCPIKHILSTQTIDFQ